MGFRNKAERVMHTTRFRFFGNVSNCMNQPGSLFLSKVIGMVWLLEWCFSTGMIFPSLPGDSWQCLETLLIVTTEEEEVLLASRRTRPGVRPNLLQGTGQPPPQRMIQPKTSIGPRVRHALL